MRRSKALNKVWNALSYLMGTAYNWIILAATLLLVYLYTQKGFSTGYEYAESSLVKASKTEIQFVVNEGDTPKDVYARLEKEGVIGNALLFRIENMIKSESTDYKPGEYSLNSEMSIEKINAILRKDPANTDITIRLLEGFSIRDINTYLEDKEIMPATNKEPETGAEEGEVESEEGEDIPPFIWASYQHKFTSRVLEGAPMGEHWLEGYLFPDTYNIRGSLAPPDTADSIINKMLTRFEDIYYEQFDGMAAEMGISMHKAVTIASIVEKEFPRKDERRIGAAVIHNRLAGQLPLQMPSTLLYAFNEEILAKTPAQREARPPARLDRLAEADLDLDSPYNTYNKTGLPPTPICNPGAECIQAALDPDGDWKYCLLVDTDTYEHSFFENEEDFLAALESYGGVYNRGLAR